MTEPLRQEFIANPVQQQFIESRAQADLFSSRKGEGKSAALAWAIFFHTKHNPGARWLVIRDTWENLRKTTLNEFLFWFPDGVYGTWHKGDKTYTWNTARTGLSGEVVFMGVESDEDASKIASMPLGAFAIDEPAGAAGESSGVSEFVFETAFAQLRQPGMNWYAVKLATNNPDESHWTYRKFVDPGTPPDTVTYKLMPLQEPGFRVHQPKKAENVHNLPPGYYENMARQWEHRPDLVRRFVDGKYGFQQIGRAVTPEWADEMHLAQGLVPLKGIPLQILYDGGLNPTAIITQITPLGNWLFLHSFVGQEEGMLELIEDRLKPLLQSQYRGFTWKHIGDPNLVMREQSSARQSAARAIVKELGGQFIKGAVDQAARIEPLRAVLRRHHRGVGVVQVDKHNCRHVWHALRGGWHYHVHRNGTVGNVVKNVHSHPGDAVGYGAGFLFPLGKLQKQQGGGHQSKSASYFNRSPAPGTSLGMARKDVKVPAAMRTIGK